MGVEDLRTKILDHLETKPISEFYPRGHLLKEAQLKWRQALMDLRRPLVQGESTGDIATDYALAHESSLSGIIETESYLRHLQQKVAANVGQEILAVSTSFNGDRGFYGQDIWYPYQIYRLAKIEEGHLQVVVDPNTKFLDLVVVTKGQAVWRSGFVAAFYGDKLGFVRGNLSVPRKGVVGTEEMTEWRQQQPHEEYYQKLSQCLTKHLSPVPTS